MTTKPRVFVNWSELCDYCRLCSDCAGRVMRIGRQKGVDLIPRKDMEALRERLKGKFFELFGDYTGGVVSDVNRVIDTEFNKLTGEER